MSLQKLRDTLSTLVSNIYFNIRGIENVPNEVDELVSVYVDSSSVEYPSKTDTSYIVIYAKRTQNPTDIVEFEGFRKRALRCATTLINSLSVNNAEVRYGNNDMYFFAEIRLTLKEVENV